MKYEDKTFKQFVRDCISLYFKPLKKLITNDLFYIPFLLFFFGFLIFIFSISFNINTFLLETLTFSLFFLIIYFFTHTYAVIQVGFVFIILNSLIWYLISLLFI